MEPLKLANNKKEWFYIFAFLSFILFISTYNQYTFFKKISYDEIYETKGKIVNIYEKETKNILKIEAEEFTFFTDVKKDLKLKKFESYSFIMVTEKINFINYMRGFYAPIFDIERIDSNKTIIENINKNISNQHQNKQIGELYNALFLATPISKELRNISSAYGISHVIAISGFHLGIISFVSFWILNFLYSPIHQKYFPYRNKKFDLLIIVSILLFGYLIILNIIPSFLRSFVMFIIGIFLLRSNIKIVSFASLALASGSIIALFPKLIFSIGLWFSIVGVFYIFLFAQYFSNINKYLAFIFFNFWIFFAINPITHYFFGTTSIVQLISPLITISFIIFYPLELILHIFQFGNLFDKVLIYWLDTTPNLYDKFSPLWFFLLHIVLSLLSIEYKIFFYILNVSIFTFALILYL